MTGTSRILLVLAAAGAGFGGGLLAHAIQPAPKAARADVPPREAGVPAEARDLQARERIDLLARRLEDRLTGLERRLAARVASEGAAAAERAADATETRETRETTDAAEARDGDVSGGRVVETLLQELRSRPYTHARSERLFGHLSRRHGEIASTIERLREAVARDSKNPHLHAALGTALSAKTAFGTPPGPEQGRVWAEAEQAFQRAIELDPDHWEARYSLAFGDSMAPEFVGLRPRAVRRFKELVEIQERQAPAEDHVLAYMRLGTLYKDAGNRKKARATWERGLERHPGAAQLEQALALIGEDGR